MQRLVGAAAGLCFLAIQFAIGMHGASAEALAPDHDASVCEFCLGAPGAGDAPAPLDPLLPAIAFADEPAPTPALPRESFEIAALPPARGPPSL